MKSPIRLVHITTVPETLIFLTGQVGEMTNRGFDVVVISSPGAALRSFGQRERISTHAVEMPRRITPLRDLWAVGRIYRQLCRIRPHIVHAHTPKGGLLGMIAAWLAGVPVRIYHVHGLPYLTAAGLRRMLVKTTERISCALANRVLCVSPSIREVAVHDGLCPAARSLSSERHDQRRGRHGHSIPRVLQAAEGRRESGAASRRRKGHWLRRPYRAGQGRHRAGRCMEVLAPGVSESASASRGALRIARPASRGSRDALRNDPRIHLTGFQSDPRTALCGDGSRDPPTYREGFPTFSSKRRQWLCPSWPLACRAASMRCKTGSPARLCRRGIPQTLVDAIRSYLRRLRLAQYDTAARVERGCWKTFGRMSSGIGTIASTSEVAGRRTVCSREQRHCDIACCHSLLMISVSFHAGLDRTKF